MFETAKQWLARSFSKPQAVEPIVTNRWATYICQVNHELASILLNVALIDDKPSRSKSALIWIWLTFRAPRPDGLSSSEEAPMLYQIEDALAETLGRRCAAVLGGRITTLGRREFYFYGATDDGCEAAIAETMKAYPTYQFETNSESDPEWHQYLDVLYPTEEQFQSIGNQEVLEQLAKNGDDHSIVRPVSHWAAFQDGGACRDFADAAKAFDFTTEEFRSDGVGATAFTVRLGVHHAVDNLTIDDATLRLFRLAKQYDGSYDGWETQATESPSASD